jgi:hypothetical protein
MTDYTVNANLTVRGGSIDRDRLQTLLDAGLAELPGIASRYGITIVTSEATVEENG